MQAQHSWLALPISLPCVLVDSCAVSSSAVVLVNNKSLGLGVGLSSVLTPLFIAEISPPSLRGSLGTICYFTSHRHPLLRVYDAVYGLWWDHVHQRPWYH